MDVAAEIVENDLCASDGLGEHDPTLVPRNIGQDLTGSASEVEEVSAEVFGESEHGDEERLLPSGWVEPGLAIGGQAAGGQEHVHVGMPLEGAGPGVQHGEGADLSAEPARVGAKCGERVEGSAKQDGQELPLVRANDSAQLRGQSEDDVEVRHRQEQGALTLEPAASGVISTLGAGAVPARMVQQMRAAARGALGEVSAECTGATAQNGRQGTDVARQYGGAVAIEVVLPMPAHDVGELEHRRRWLEPDHQAVEDFLQPLHAGLSDMHVDFRGAQRLVAEQCLNRTQRDAGLEQMSRVAVA